MKIYITLLCAALLTACGGGSDTPSPDNSSSPETPIQPEIPVVPETPEIPEVPEHPEIPEVPETPKPSVDSSLAISAAWLAYADAIAQNDHKSSQLPDYSYSGYAFSEKKIPETATWQMVNVKDHGAIPDDNQFDDAAINRAIEAANKITEPVVLFFPAGRYKIGGPGYVNDSLVINRSNIVIKGAGSGDNGSEIYAPERGNHPWRVVIAPDGQVRGGGSLIASASTELSASINRGDMSVNVKSASAFKVGDMVNLAHSNTDNASLKLNLGEDRSYDVQWFKAATTLRLNTSGGLRAQEKHLISRIDENTVYFTAPVKINLPADGSKLERYQPLTEIGIENIRFSGGWHKYQDPDGVNEFKHHKDDIHDYAWRALEINAVHNAWLKSVDFNNLNEGVAIYHSAAITADNISFSGKKGHTAIFAHKSYGVLIQNSHENAGHHHGPGMRWSATNTVYKNVTFKAAQFVDCHGYHPYSNLLDNVNGAFDNNGGAENAYPNHAHEFTFWNYYHDNPTTRRNHDFWNLSKRENNMYIDPLFIGLKVKGEPLVFKNVGLDELRQQNAYPYSLFDAQLQLRLNQAFATASSTDSGSNANHIVDGNPSSAWRAATAGDEQWLIIDFGHKKAIESVNIRENGDVINEYKLEYFSDDKWVEIEVGNNVGTNKTITFTEVNTRRMRFSVNSVLSGQSASKVSIASITAS